MLFYPVIKRILPLSMMYLVSDFDLYIFLPIPLSKRSRKGNKSIQEVIIIAIILVDTLFGRQLILHCFQVLAKQDM